MTWQLRPAVDQASTMTTAAAPAPAFQPAPIGTGDYVGNTALAASGPLFTAMNPAVVSAIAPVLPALHPVSANPPDNLSSGDSPDKALGGVGS